MAQSRLIIPSLLAVAVSLFAGEQARSQPSTAKPKASLTDDSTELDPFIAKAIKPDPTDTPLKKLQKERCSERAIALVKLGTAIKSGQREDVAEYLKLQITLSENLIELVNTPADKIKCYEMRIAALKEAERVAGRRVDFGHDPSYVLNLVKAARIDAEIALMKFKELPPTPGLSPNAPPDRPVGVTKKTEIEEVEAAIAPYVEKARKTYPDAKKRYLAGLAKGHAFFVVTKLKDDAGRFEQVFVSVASIKDGQITGRIASSIRTVKGFKNGDPHTFGEADLVDWLITNPDGLEEGNVVGKFLDEWQKTRKQK